MEYGTAVDIDIGFREQHFGIALHLRIGQRRGMAEDQCAVVIEPVARIRTRIDERIQRIIRERDVRIEAGGFFLTASDRSSSSLSRDPVKRKNRFFRAFTASLLGRTT